MDDFELEALLSLDGASYEIAQGYVVEFTARRTDLTPERPHGISYALVFRAKAGGKPRCGSTTPTRSRGPAAGSCVAPALSITGTGQSGT